MALYEPQPKRETNVGERQGMRNTYKYEQHHEQQLHQNHTIHSIHLFPRSTSSLLFINTYLLSTCHHAFRHYSTLRPGGLPTRNRSQMEQQGCVSRVSTSIEFISTHAKTPPDINMAQSPVRQEPLFAMPMV